jgi:hypothetical protein
VLRIVHALAADVAARDDAGAALLHHFPDQAVLQRFTRLDPAAEQVPVPLAIAIAIAIASAEDDQTGPGEADAVGLVRVRRFGPERRIESGEGDPTALVDDLLDRSRFGFGQTRRVAARRHNALHKHRPYVESHRR